MAQVKKLLSLSPAMQVAILCGELKVSERAIRPVVETVAWREQEALMRR